MLPESPSGISVSKNCVPEHGIDAEHAPWGSDCLSLPDITGRHLGSSGEKCWPINLARDKVINKETSVDHDGHPRSQKGENSRLSRDLFITVLLPFQRTVGLVCREQFTLEKRWWRALAPQLRTVQDDCSVCVVLKLSWQMFPYFLLWYPDPHRP